MRSIDVHFENFKQADLQQLYSILTEQKDISYWCGFKYPETLQETQDYLNKLKEKEHWYAIKSGDSLLGCISLTNLFSDTYELGYWVSKRYRKRGIIYNAIQVMKKKAFEELGCNTLYCGYFEGNEASKNVQTKCGFKPDNKIKLNILGEDRIEYITKITKQNYASN